MAKLSGRLMPNSSFKAGLGIGDQARAELGVIRGLADDVLVYLGLRTSFLKTGSWYGLL